MPSMIANAASPDAGGDPDPGIVEDYKARLQALGYSPGLTGKCIRTILHLIAWLSANGTGIETLDIRVLHRFLEHDCACPGPRGYPIPDAGNAQGPELAGLLLRDQDLPHRFRCVRPIPQIPRQFPDGRSGLPTPYRSMSVKVSPSTPAEPPLRRTRLQASARKSSRHTLSTSA